jgi:GcrA cell cycle regulator
MGVATIPWTAERLETLRTLWLQGYSASQIAAQLGVSRNAVIGQVHRKGWQRNGASPPAAKKASDAAGGRFRWTAENDAKLADMFDRGATDDEIAAALGNSVWSVISRRKVLRMLRERQAPAPKIHPQPRNAAEEPPAVVTLAWSPLPGVEPMRRAEASARYCKWPITVDSDELAFCCGAIATEGAYCAAHKRKSIAPKQPAEIAQAKRRQANHASKIYGRAA